MPHHQPVEKSEKTSLPAAASLASSSAKPVAKTSTSATEPESAPEPDKIFHMLARGVAALGVAGLAAFAPIAPTFNPAIIDVAVDRKTRVFFISVSALNVNWAADVNRNQSPWSRRGFNHTSGVGLEKDSNDAGYRLGVQDTHRGNKFPGRRSALRVHFALWFLST